MQTPSRISITHLVLGVGSGVAMALAAWLLIAPHVGPPPLFPFQDKLFHAVAFAGLAAPGVLALPRRYLWFWLAHLIALGIGIELVQSAGGLGRSGSVWDILADLAGIGLALGLGRLIRSRFEVPNRS